MERKRVLPHSVFQPIERQKANLIKTRTRMGIFVFKRNLVPSVPNRVTESKTDQPPLSSSHSVTKTQDNLLHHRFDRIRKGDVDTPPIKEPTPNLPTPGAAKHHMAKIFHLCFTEHTKPICLFMQDMPLEKILSSRKLIKTPTPQKTAEFFWKLFPPQQLRWQDQRVRNRGALTERPKRQMDRVTSLAKTSPFPRVFYCRKDFLRRQSSH
ncbi:hypothetical protein Ancab_040330 [Ancistrocladus abbreviatus]